MVRRRPLSTPTSPMAMPQSIDENGIGANSDPMSMLQSILSGATSGGGMGQGIIGSVIQEILKSRAAREHAGTGGAPSAMPPMGGG
jgi:hypothetical protein